MPHARRIACTLVLGFAVAVCSGTAEGQGNEEGGKRPSLALKVNPPMAVAPARVRGTVEVRGGADDYEPFYCPTVEWDWGDETTSEATLDCEPYVAGKSEIRRRFSGDHTYQTSGNYKVTFRLKQKTKVVASASSNVQVRPGFNEPF